jgi:hypothetical protein
MTKEDPDQLINAGPYLVPIVQRMERSGWSYQRPSTTQQSQRPCTWREWLA